MPTSNPTTGALRGLAATALARCALKNPAEKRDIQWLVNMDDSAVPLLHPRWRERGIPAIPVRPAQQGFGRDLIEHILPNRLSATGSRICFRTTVPLIVHYHDRVADLEEEDDR